MAASQRRPSIVERRAPRPSDCTLTLDSHSVQGETRFSLFYPNLIVERRAPRPSTSTFNAESGPLLLPMLGSPQSDDPLLSEHPSHALPGTEPAASNGTAHPSHRSALEEPELEAALQLLVERAQYITGATGTALALPQGDEMVCRASAGSCAPAVGARLQVRSGLTGESMARRQLLRCDNAETDPRVNLEACQALGIASIVVLPLLRRNGEVRGLFELFSDHPYAFEERDLIALERMADLTLTALDLAEQRHGSVPPRPLLPKQQEAKQPEKAPEAAMPASPETASSGSEQPAIESIPLTEPAPPEPAPTESATSALAAMPAELILAPPPEISSPEPEPVPALESPLPPPAPVPEAMRRVQKCASCGFPVSEGRTTCLDCERLDREKKESERKWLLKQQAETKQLEPSPDEKKEDQAEPSSALAPDEILPPFLANAAPLEESWLANHVNLLAILVLIVGILVAIVVFR